MSHSVNPRSGPKANSKNLVAHRSKLDFVPARAPLGLCLLVALQAIGTLAFGQEMRSLPAAQPAQEIPQTGGAGLPIRTLPSSGLKPFVFPAPRDYQTASVTASFSDLEPAASMAASATPSPLDSALTTGQAEALMEGVDWDQATPVDLAPESKMAAVNCSPFGEYFYLGAGTGPQESWVIGNGDRLGIYTMAFVHRSNCHVLGWLNFDINASIHFLSGPVQTDLPPRVYDFTIDFPYRGTLGESWTYDIRFRTGWFTDFEGSARDGVRFPAHAVLYRRVSDVWQWVLGIDYLDRDDVSLLPVGGALWTPAEDWRVEAVFPKPLIARRCLDDRWIYLAAEMGGGTWDIERIGGTEDIFTYRDYRLVLGFQSETSEQGNCLEIGYVFGRHLEYRSGTPDYRPSDSILLRSVQRY